MSKDKASSRINNRIGTANKPTKKSSLITVLFPTLIVSVAIGGIIFVLKGQEPEPRNAVVTPENIEEVIQELEANEKTPQGSYEVMMTTNWTFPKIGSASKDAYVENAITNTNTVYFTINLAGTETEIYKSPYIDVGSYLSGITLDYPLDAGTYETVLTYHLVDTSHVEISHVSVALTITIEQ